VGDGVTLASFRACVADSDGPDTLGVQVCNESFSLALDEERDETWGDLIGYGWGSYRGKLICEQLF
jgi:hypothetical protein